MNWLFADSPSRSNPMRADQPEYTRYNHSARPRRHYRRPRVPCRAHRSPRTIRQRSPYRTRNRLRQGRLPSTSRHEHPELNFLGIEWANEFYKYSADAWPPRHHQRSHHAYRCPALRHSSLAESSLAALHIYHPDPWPKSDITTSRLISRPSSKLFPRSCRSARAWPSRPTTRILRADSSRHGHLPAPDARGIRRPGLRNRRGKHPDQF